MIVFKISGGLGNQLFQYAALEKLRADCHGPIFLDLSEFSSLVRRLRGGPRRQYYLNELGLDLKPAPAALCIALRFLVRIISPQRRNRAEPPSIDEYITRYNQSRIRILYIDSLFQTTEIYEYCERNFRESLNAHMERVTRKYKIEGPSRHNVTAVQIRGSDYIKNSLNSSLFGVCNRLYYLAAVETMAAKHQEICPEIDIFTDDPCFVESFKFPFQFKLRPKQETLSEFLALMQYEYIVISNSTFAWWAAYLGKRHKTVIRPTPWFDKLQREVFSLPPQWIDIKK